MVADSWTSTSTRSSSACIRARRATLVHRTARPRLAADSGPARGSQSTLRNLYAEKEELLASPMPALPETLGSPALGRAAAAVAAAAAALDPSSRWPPAGSPLSGAPTAPGTLEARTASGPALDGVLVSGDEPDACGAPRAAPLSSQRTPAGSAAATPAAGSEQRGGAGAGGPYTNPSRAGAAQLLLSPLPGGALADLLLATSVRRGTPRSPLGAPAPAGSGAGPEQAGAAPNSPLPEIGSPAHSLVPAAPCSPAEAGPEAAAAAPAPAAAEGDADRAELGDVLLLPPGAAALPHAEAAAPGAAEPAGAGPGAGQAEGPRGGSAWAAAPAGGALPLLSPPEVSPAEPGEAERSPDRTAADDALPAWAETWAEDAARVAEALERAGDQAASETAPGEARAGQALQGGGPVHAALRGSLVSSPSLSPRLRLTFDAALAEVDAWEGPSLPVSPGATLDASPGAAGAPRSADWGVAPPAPALSPEMPCQAPAGQATPGSGPAQGAHTLRRSLEAALAEAGRDAAAAGARSGGGTAAAPAVQSRPVGDLVGGPPVGGNPSEAGSARACALPGLELGPGASPSLSSPSLGAPSSSTRRYSPVDLRTPDGMGRGPPLWAAAGRPAEGAPQRSARGGAPDAAQGSPVAAPLSPNTVQRLSMYNSVALAEAGGGFPADRGASPGSASPAGTDWRVALFDGGADSDDDGGRRGGAMGGGAPA